MSAGQLIVVGLVGAVGAVIGALGASVHWLRWILNDKGLLSELGLDSVVSGKIVESKIEKIELDTELTAADLSGVPDVSRGQMDGIKFDPENRCENRWWLSTAGDVAVVPPDLSQLTEAEVFQLLNEYADTRTPDPTDNVIYGPSNVNDTVRAVMFDEPGDGEYDDPDIDFSGEVLPDGWE